MSKSGLGIESEAQKIKQKLQEAEAVNVKLATFGQPGAGKSTLINKLMGRKVVEVGVETDMTKKKSEHEWKSGIDLIDLPGYDTKRFKKETFFQEFNIPSIDLFLCITDGKLHDADNQFFRELRAAGKTCIFVSSKCDELWEEGFSDEQLRKRRYDDLKKHIGEDAQIVFVSSRTGEGLDKLQMMIYENLEPAKKERWLRAAKAYSIEFLEKKRKACEEYVLISAGVSAVGSLNPIPGTDVAVDLCTMTKLFKEIRNDYGLDQTTLDSIKESTIPAFSRMADRLIMLATEQGLMSLLKRYAGRQLTRTVAKYIPFIGQAIAMSAGFTITHLAGTDYLNDCHAIAKDILEQKLSQKKSA